MTENDRKRLPFLILGHSPAGAFHYPHPATISVYPRGNTTLINFSMGVHLINSGGQRTVTTVILNGELNEMYAEEFDACEARWLVPQLAQLAANEPLTARDLIQSYQSRHGRPPKSEWSADYTL